MPRSAKIAVCVDSSIFLAEVFGNETQSTRAGAIDWYQAIFQFKKCMSETVKNEVGRRVCEVAELIERVSKDFIRKFLSSKGEGSTINLSDLTLIQSFFSEFKARFRFKTSELEVINNMESVLVQYLVENYGRKKGLKTRDFALDSMVEFNKKLSGLRYEYNSKLSGYEVFSTRVNPETCRKLQNERALEKTVRRKPQDIRILCEVEAYRHESEQACLLATVDDHDFLSNSKTIELLIGIKCVDPIYIPNEFAHIPNVGDGSASL